MSAPAGSATPKKGPGGRTAGSKSLTTAQKAEAAALWRSGSVTLEDLAKKFKKRPETFSRLFSRMSIEKGSGVAAAMKKAEDAIATRALTDVEETLKRIATVRDSHFRMSQALAIMAFKDIQQAKAGALDVGKLKDVMAVYKMASDVIGNSRKELFAVLDVEKHEKDKELDELPELTVRELTQSEVNQLTDAPIDDLDGESLGAGMLDLDDEDGAP